MNYIKSPHKLFTAFIISFLVIGMSACSDSFLNIPSTSSIDASKALTTVKGLKTALNGAYDYMQNTDTFGRLIYVLPDLMADNTYLSIKNSNRYTDYDNYTVTRKSGTAASLWQHMYRIIANCNLIIGSAPSIDGDQNKKDAIVGQAYAIRALSEFILVRFFAQPYNYTPDASHPGVPVITHSSITLKKKVDKPERSTVKEVYDSIINDFQTAIDLLPTALPGYSSSFKGKITKNAARALLSRVYVNKGDWEGAEGVATDVIESKQYKLLSTSNFVSEYNSDNNSESIFEIVFSSTDNPSTGSLSSFYNQGGSYGDIIATQSLYDIYDKNDVRRNFMEIGDRNAGGAETNVPLILKYQENTDNINIIRLGEVYLNRAEAEAHIPGKENDAIADLKEVAKRSEPTITIDPNLTGQQLIDRILLERRKELAFEGQRLFDLTRNGKSFNLHERGGVIEQIDSPADETILPIPQSAIDVNGNLDQNPGYN